ncbi:MAG: hypothetical protein ACRC7O_07495 [Fimbriiglobus sp.]
MIRTVRNCLPVIRFVCPKTWESMSSTDDPHVRHCQRCDRAVHYCADDESTIAHARLGHCIAREMHEVKSLRRVFIGLASEVEPETPEQTVARQLLLREQGIDDAIRNTGMATRTCPQCHYPAPDWRVACRVCGFAFGRVAPATEE